MDKFSWGKGFMLNSLNAFKKPSVTYIFQIAISLEIQPGNLGKSVLELW